MCLFFHIVLIADLRDKFLLSLYKTCTNYKRVGENDWGGGGGNGIGCKMTKGENKRQNGLGANCLEAERLLTILE